MKSMLISFGQAAEHSRWLVQEPNHRSISSTIPSVRIWRSGWPCGSRLRCASLAAVKSWPAPFGQAATQAPQPMHCSGVHRAVRVGFGHRDQVRVGRRAGRRRDVAAGLDDAIERAPVDHEILDQRKAGGAERLDHDGVAVVEQPQVHLARRGAALGPVRVAVDHQPARAADALAAVRVERDRLAALRDQPLVQTRRAAPGTTSPRSARRPRRSRTRPEQKVPPAATPAA